MSAIPWVGQDIVEFIWGGFSVNNATLNRFFALHFVLPFVLAALVLMHLIALHDSAGSNNPLGISGNYDRLPFAPYFLFKDLITIFLFILILSILVFFMPNLLGDSENYVMANPMQTPPAIVPEWYLLPFYAILRSIPNKLLGVIAMFSAILILLAMPFTDLSRSRGIQFRPLSKIAFFIFVGNFLILMQLGAKHVESPFIEFGQISTVLYFAHFLIIVPLISLFENSLVELPVNLEDIEYNTENSLSLQASIIPTLEESIDSEDLEKNSEELETNLEEFERRTLYVNVNFNTHEYKDFLIEKLKKEAYLNHLRFQAVHKDNVENEKLIKFLRKQVDQDRPLEAGLQEPVESRYNDDNNTPYYDELQSSVFSEKILSTYNLCLLSCVLVLTYIGNYLNSSYNTEYCDTPRPWGVYFQDSATPQMEGLVELHDNILFYLVIILFGVGWILVSIVRNYQNEKSPISHKYLNHGTLIELIWTITPALILILIAFPSFKLLYLMDEVSDPAMCVLAEGHQWYWSYQYPDFLNSDEEFIEFDSYLVPESDLEDGALRMLEVDNRVILPELTHVRFIVTGADVIHSFACPALGIKCDAYPGRLSQVSVLVNREGTFYGQCSEICGILHSSMPIVIESVSIEKFLAWLEEQ